MIERIPFIQASYSFNLDFLQKIILVVFFNFLFCDTIIQVVLRDSLAQSCHIGESQDLGKYSKDREEWYDPFLRLLVMPWL